MRYRCLNKKEKKTLKTLIIDFSTPYFRIFVRNLFLNKFNITFQTNLLILRIKIHNQR